MDLFRLFAQDFTRCLMDCLDYLSLCLPPPFSFFFHLPSFSLLSLSLSLSLWTSHLFIISFPLSTVCNEGTKLEFFSPRMRINDEIMRNYEEEKIFLSLVGSVFVIVERMNRKEKIRRSNRKSITIFNNIFFYKMLILWNLKNNFFN